MDTFCKGKHVLLCAWLIISTIKLHAQKATYTLNDLVTSSQKHLPALLQKQAQFKMAEAGITDARHAALPSLKVHDEVIVGTDNSLPGSYFTMGVIPSSSGGIRSAENWNAAAGNIGTIYSEYELYNFGLNTARKEDARSNAAFSQSDYERMLYLVKSDLAKLYFGILKYQSRLKADNQNIARYQALFNVTQALTRSGIKPGADSAQALAELSKARTAATRTEMALMQLREQMASYTGIPVTEIILDTSIAQTLPTQEALASLKEQEYNPLINYYKRQKEAYLTSDRLIRKTYLPRITLVGALWGRGSSISYNDKYPGQSTDGFTSGLNYQRFNYAAALAFSYNLFDIIHRKDKLAVNRYKIMAGEYAIEQEKLNLQTASAQADIQIKTAVQNLKEVAIQEKSAQDVFDQKKAQYKAGLTNLIDLTNASFVLYRSQTDYIETLNDWYVAQLNKAAASGNLDQFIQSIK